MRLSISYEMRGRNVRRNINIITGERGCVLSASIKVMTFGSSLFQLRLTRRKGVRGFGIERESRHTEAPRKGKTIWESMI